MPLMRIRAYQRTLFAEGQAPDRRTVISWIKRGELHGVQIGSVWYVDPDAPPPSPPGGVADPSNVSRLLAKLGINKP